MFGEMNKNPVATARPLWFLVSALLLMGVLAGLVALGGFHTSWLRLGVLTPSLLALLFVSFLDADWQSQFFRQFLFGERMLLWLAISLLCFPALAWLASLGGHWLYGVASAPGHLPQVNTILLIVFLSLGEEVGWRGYALPRLAERIGWRKATLVVGAAWWLWHTPGWLLGFGAPTDISFLLFGVWVISAAFLFTYVYVRSGGSVWTAVILHAGANLSFQIFPIMPGAAGGPQNFLLLCGLSVLLAIVACRSQALSHSK